MSKRKGDSAGRERAAKHELLTDVAAELRDRPYDFQLTDIRGSGYYGPYHSLIVAEAIKKRLRQRVTECSELSLARAAEQMLPLLFARLIEKDGNIARRAAADVLRDSRVYGLLVFPASILNLARPNLRGEARPNIAAAAVDLSPDQRDGDSPSPPEVPVLSISSDSVRHPDTPSAVARFGGGEAPPAPLPLPDGASLSVVAGSAGAAPARAPLPAPLLHAPSLHAPSLRPPSVVAGLDGAAPSGAPLPAHLLRPPSVVARFDGAAPAGAPLPEPSRRPPSVVARSIGAGAAPPSPIPPHAASPSVVAGFVGAGAAPAGASLPPPPPRPPGVAGALPPSPPPSAGPRQPLAPQAAAPAQPQGWKPPVEWRSTGRYPVKEGTQPIEQGGFGTVYHCIDRLLPNFEVAKKRQQWDEGDPVPNRYILREVAALRRCNGHNNVIHLKDVIYNADPAGPYVDIILPLTTASLDKVIRVNRAGVDVITAKTFLQQVVAGLSWIHKRGWIHCDLKPENVLVFKDYTCRITDFGLAKVKNPAQRLARPCGTIGYRPPEELFNNHFADESMDIWPLGTIYAELRKGGRLFDASSNLACFKSMIEVTGIDRRTVYEFPEADASIDGARSFALCKADPTRLWLLTRTNCRSSCPSSSWSPNDVHPRKASVSIRPGRSTLRQIEPF